ncbi:MAG TPA: DUF2304 family protein [Solirubrobacterales bacterium]|nr:DUF2304 family protein [Solirubrobacterales bacterium]
MRRLVLVIALVAVFAADARAATITVEGEPGTALGEAIVEAEPGDTIRIPPGDWVLTEGDVLEEKDLALQGAGFRETTVLPSGGGDAFDDAGVSYSGLRVGDPLNPEGANETEDEGGIETKAQIIALVVTFAIFLFILDLVRRRRLSERYALLWMTAALALLVLSIWTGGLDAIADLMGIQEPANAIFIIAFAVVFLLLLNFSVVSSRMGEETKVLAQEVARLEQELRLERSLRGGEPNGFSGRASESEQAQDEPPVRRE